MARNNRQAFIPTGDYVTRKDFRFHARSFSTGKPFPWRQLSCSVRRLRQLYEANYIELSGKQRVAAPIPGEGSVNQPVDPTKPWEGPIGSQTISDGPLVFDPEIHEIDNPDRGVWLMLNDGKTICRLTAAEAKRLRKAKNPTEVNPEEIRED